MTDSEPLWQPLLGTWTGRSTLWLDPESEGDTQPSTAVIGTVAKGKILRVEYVWHVDDAAEEGFMICGRAAGKRGFSGAWADSWHQLTIMSLSGDGDDAIDLRGKYQATGYPEWGWRIRLQVDDDVLRLLMWNVTPEGVEQRAVEGVYERGAAQGDGP